MVKIIESIGRKITEHEIEVNKCIEELESISKTLKSNSYKDEKSLTSAGKYFIVKDKLTFHKGCLLTLIELKKEVEEELCQKK